MEQKQGSRPLSGLARGMLEGLKWTRITGQHCVMSETVGQNSRKLTTFCASVSPSGKWGENEDKSAIDLTRSSECVPGPWAAFLPESSQLMRTPDYLGTSLSPTDQATLGKPTPTLNLP